MTKTKEEINLHKMYPNLTFYISPDREVSVWNTRKYESLGEQLESGSEGITLNKKYTPEDLPNKYFDDLNSELQKIADEPDKYFWCTTCSQVKPKTELEENVFAGYYCKQCASENKWIRDLIAESHTRGFYD